MLASLLIVFREVLEAGLIVGIVFAATEGIAGRVRWIGGGIAAGALGAALLAMFAGALSNALSGQGQEYFNATVMLLAVGMLGWHHLWMADHGRELAMQLKQLGSEISAGRSSLAAMAMVVALAILREGAEVVLFLYGIVAASQEGPLALFLGGLSGLALGAAVSFVLFIAAWWPSRPSGCFRSPAFCSRCWPPAWPARPPRPWPRSARSRPWATRYGTPLGCCVTTHLLGRALHVLTGYSDRPSGVQLLAYGLTLVTFVVAGRLMHRNHARRHRPALQGAAK